jgi:tetratricopeptide (TPR) repeat protein
MKKRVLFTIIILTLAMLVATSGCTSNKPNLSAQDYNQQGLSLANQGNYKDAVTAYTKAIKLDSQDAQFYFNRGTTYLDMNQFDLAIADFDKAIQLDPNYAKAYNSRGNAYRDKEQYDLAIADYNKAIELDPKDVDAYSGRGGAYYLKMQYDLAIADLSEAITLDPTHAFAYLVRGWTYDKKMQYDLAIADYSKVIELAPKYAQGYADRATAYYAKGQKDLAIADFNKVLQLTTDADLIDHAKKMLENLAQNIPFLAVIPLPPVIETPPPPVINNENQQGNVTPGSDIAGNWEGTFEYVEEEISYGFSGGKDTRLATAKGEFSFNMVVDTHEQTLLLVQGGSGTMAGTYTHHEAPSMPYSDSHGTFEGVKFSVGGQAWDYSTIYFQDFTPKSFLVTCIMHSYNGSTSSYEDETSEDYIDFYDGYMFTYCATHWRTWDVEFKEGTQHFHIEMPSYVGGLWSETGDMTITLKKTG